MMGLGYGVIVCSALALEDPGFQISHLDKNVSSPSREGAECHTTLGSQGHCCYIRALYRSTIMAGEKYPA